MARHTTPPRDPNRFQRLDVAQLGNLHEELREGKRFVCWRVEIRDGKPTKVPINPHNGKKAKPNDPTTWGTYPEAVAYYLAHQELSGIGRMFDPADDILGVDFDNCFDEQGRLIPDHAAARWLPRLNSYSEISPSGRGVHVFASLVGKTAEQHASLEVTTNGVETGWRASPITGWSDEEILARSRRGPDGQKFQDLYAGNRQPYHPSRSEADAALCELLGLAIDDRETVRRLWGKSALGRRKKWKDKDYQQRTIDWALGRAHQIRAHQTALPLFEYVAVVIQRTQASSRTQPKWQSLFHCARLLKAHPELKDLDGLDVAAAIDPILSGLADGKDPWQHSFAHLFDDPAHADPKAALASLWGSVKSSALDNPLEQAFFQSRLLPFVPVHPLSDGYHLFLSLAAHLQKLLPDRSILLPVELVGNLLGYERHTISHYLHLAKLSGHLRELAPSLYAKHQATEYRFSVENWGLYHRQGP
jgi:hypothetical protein